MHLVTRLRTAVAVLRGRPTLAKTDIRSEVIRLPAQSTPWRIANNTVTSGSGGGIWLA